MAKVLVTEDYLKNIGDAIRSKTETEDKFTPSQMADAISNIKSGESALWTTNGRLYYKQLQIAEGVTSIQGQQFVRILDLTSIIFPSTVKTVGVQSFLECTGLVSVDFSNATSLTSLGNQAFRSCSLLQGVDLMNTPIENLGGELFSGCRNLSVLKLPKTLLSIVNNNAFSGCIALKDVTLEQGFLCSLNISASTKYEVSDIVGMLNALGTVPEGETRTLTIGATNLEKLTDEQKLIATDKRWTLA